MSKQSIDGVDMPTLLGERITKACVFVAAVFLLLPGCAVYKELQPDPELSPLERGYIELKDGKDNFMLDKEDKYFIKFPRPTSDNFYVVLTTRAKPSISSYLTRTFDDGKGVPIADESASSDSISVYAIDAKTLTYFWVIDTVRNDLELVLRYRYVPQWRYTFENKYDEFKEILANSTVDRSTYNSIDIRFDVDRLDFGREIPYVEGRTARIKSMRDELIHLETVFPPGIAATRDTAYELYVAFRGKVDNELTFQENYSSILNLFKKERDTRGNTATFLEAAPFFTNIVSEEQRFPASIRVKAYQVLLGRLSEVTPYLDNILRNKHDASKVTPEPPLDAVSGLYRACGQPIPLQTETILRFVARFNREVEGLEATKGKFASLGKYFTERVGSPGESFYADLITRVGEIRSGLPEPQSYTFERYGNYSCTAMLRREIMDAGNRTTELLTMYQTASTAASHLGSRQWAAAEMQLRELHTMGSTSAFREITAQRTTLVRQFENDFFNAVRSASEQRIDAFIKAHEMAIDSVPQLYQDSAFLPVYELTFSSVGSADLLRKRNQITGYLDQIKYIQFPENSIRSIYSDFTRSMKDRGVEKARAIVEHGKFYGGTDRQVKGLIDECDVEAPKRIARPREYRKLFALPVTNSARGTNEYMFRIRLQIPSEAQFPVFDVTLKLPLEIAEKSSQQQWFESITIDKKPIKTEGRFRVTSPTAANNYEALITPVQMDKAGRNILEVRFKYPDFRVFEVSAMAQVPIIRKN